MRSMFTGVSGLKVHQQKMDVIANNIANVNTVAYKSSRVTFNEYLSQNMQSASGENKITGKGGTNPNQVGLGVTLGSIDVDMTSGASQRTNRPLDLMINGDGFFIVGDSTGQYFTRDGNFSLDEQGNLVTSAGLKVQGWDVKESINADGKATGEYEAVQDVVKPIQISGDKTFNSPSATDLINMTGNLNATENPEHITSLSFYDSVGNRWTQDAKLTWNEDDQQWNVSLKNVAYLNGDRTEPYLMKVSGSDGTLTGEIDGLLAEATGTEEAWVDDLGAIKFDNQGLVVNDPDDPEDTHFEYTITGTNIKQNAYFGDGSVSGDEYISGPMDIDFSDLTMFGNETANATAERITGNEPGTLTGMSVTSDGSIVGSYSNGTTKMIAKIPVALFANSQGLEKAGGNLFTATLNSGEFDGIGSEIGVGGGSILGGSLEMSNVDLSSEFTEMITTQRGFQANSRTITTSDEIIQELVNLKR